MTDHFDTAGDAAGRISQSSWWLLRRMEQYVNAAIDQHARLVDGKARMTDLLGPVLEVEQAARPLFVRLAFQRIADAHFYVLCGDQVRRLFDRFRRAQEPFPDEVQLLWRSRKSRLNQFLTMRNLLEHADSEIVRGVEAGAGLSDTHFNFAGSTVDISERSLEVLTDTWRRLIDVINTMPVVETDP